MEAYIHFFVYLVHCTFAFNFVLLIILSFSWSSQGLSGLLPWDNKYLQIITFSKSEPLIFGFHKTLNWNTSTMMVLATAGEHV